MKLDVFDLAKH